MDRQYYLDLAANGLRMPIGADLFVQPKPDHEARLLDGALLGNDVIEAARHFRTPLALPLMDLRVEKEDMLTMVGIDADQIDTYHFEDDIDPEVLSAIEHGLASAPPTPRMQANADAIRHVAENSDLVPIGMCIGPFTLMTKLLADPITPVFLLGSGMSAEEEPEVAMVEQLIEYGTRIILRSIRLQCEAGAKAVCVCEPAANIVYLSPKQLEENWSIWHDLVIEPNKRIRQLLSELDADLVLHDCGELIPDMVQSYNELDPCILTLGSPCTLWEYAPLVKKDTVLFGNLPSKKFYSDSAITTEEVVAQSRELLSKMAETGHPFILGSECDVLSVPGCDELIMAKILAMIEA